MSNLLEEIPLQRRFLLCGTILLTLLATTGIFSIAAQEALRRNHADHLALAEARRGLGEIGRQTRNAALLQTAAPEAARGREALSQAAQALETWLAKETALTQTETAEMEEGLTKAIEFLRAVAPDQNANDLCARALQHLDEAEARLLTEEERRLHERSLLMRRQVFLQITLTLMALILGTALLVFVLRAPAPGTAAPLPEDP